jgi:hypothetical protein
VCVEHHINDWVSPQRPVWDRQAPLKTQGCPLRRRPVYLIRRRHKGPKVVPENCRSRCPSDIRRPSSQRVMSREIEYPVLRLVRWGARQSPRTHTSLGQPPSILTGRLPSTFTTPSWRAARSTAALRNDGVEDVAAFALVEHHGPNAIGSTYSRCISSSKDSPLPPPFPTPEDEDDLGCYCIDSQDHPPPPVMPVIEHVRVAGVEQNGHGIHVHDLRPGQNV